tara:strand:+ start:130 stop:2232 length:2103 start_codon:yes stop_codon:yes gene_type:complete
MTTSVSLSIETQTETGDVLSLCFLNKQNISLEISSTAQKMLKYNRSLFNRINNLTEIKSLMFYRKECHDSILKNNNLYAKMNNSGRIVEKDLIFVSLDDFSGEVSRIETKFGKIVDLQKRNAENIDTSTILDLNNITLDDLKHSKDICTVEEIGIFEKIGIKTFLITDKLSVDPSIYHVGYRVDVKVQHKFDDYVSMVLQALNDSIYFIKSYHSLVVSSINYDSKKEVFHESFVNRIFDSLNVNIDRADRINIGSDTFKTSEFGKAAIAFYNAQDLIMPNASKKIYNSIMRTLLPTKKTNPDLILRLVKDFESLYHECIDKYFASATMTMENVHSKIHSKLRDSNIISSETKETYQIDRSTLGYYIFSNEQDGLNRFSSNAYRTRYVLEQMRYYPQMNLGTESNFMTDSEKSDFLNRNNYPAFVTPIGIAMNGERITFERGLANTSVEKIREFRLKKSAQYKNNSSPNNLPAGSNFGASNEVLSGFNLSVGSPRDSLLPRATEESIDPLIDSRFFLGANSLFNSSNPEIPSANASGIGSGAAQVAINVLSDLVPRAFLSQENQIQNIGNLQLSNPNSAIRQAIVTNTIDLSKIPPQLKAATLPSFQPNPMVDPIANFESGQIIEETQMNIYVVRSIVGFSTSENGFSNVSDRIYKDIEKSDLESGQEILAKAFRFEVTELGILEDLSNTTIYSNLIHIRG